MLFTPRIMSLVTRLTSTPTARFSQHHHHNGCCGTGTDQDHLWSYKRIFEGNKRFVEQKLKQDPNYFTNLAKGQTPKYLLIGCSDSRVPPNELTQTEPGEMFIHRNIANQVIPADMNVNAVIQFAVEYLKVKNIVVLGHTQCGGVIGALNNKPLGGFLDCWINQIKSIYHNHQNELKDLPRDEMVNKMIELNVKESVANVWKNPYLQKAISEGNQIQVHGWVVKVETGLVHEVSVDHDYPTSLNTFKYDFKK